MQQCYLIGKGVSHSKSPAMYNALYATLGLDWTYSLADLDTEEEARAFLQEEDWLSINATTPYKPLAYQTATTKAASVQLSGGANMLFRQNTRAGESGAEGAGAAPGTGVQTQDTAEDGVPTQSAGTRAAQPEAASPLGHCIGLNTDGVGCIRHIQRSFGSLAGSRVVVCGTGPTSLAIFAAAATAGAIRIALMGRSRSRTKAVLDGFMQRYRKLAFATLDLEPARVGERSFRAAFTEPTYVFGTYETSTQEIAAADVVVDATPLGMNEGDPLPFDAALLGGQSLVYDVVYGHGQSALLAAATAAGVPVVLDGRGMVVAQAVENASVLLDAQGIDTSLSWDDMFLLMADAADVPC